MRRTKEEAAITRQNLLKAALTVISDKGYNATRLEDIAKEAGVTRGAIYWHFGSKLNLYDTLLRESYASYVTLVGEILNSNEPVLSKIRRFIIETITTVCEDEVYQALEECLFLKTEWTSEMAEVGSEVTDFLNQVTKGIENLLREGIDSGEVNPMIDPEASAVALVSYSNGLEMSWLMGDKRVPITTIAEKLAEFALCSLRKK